MESRGSAVGGRCDTPRVVGSRTGRVDWPVEAAAVRAAGNPVPARRDFYGWPLDLGDKLFRLRSGRGSRPPRIPSGIPTSSSRPNCPTRSSPAAPVQLTRRRGGRGPRSACSEVLPSAPRAPDRKRRHAAIRGRDGFRRAQVGDDDLAQWLTSGVPWRDILRRQRCRRGRRPGRGGDGSSSSRSSSGRRDRRARDRRRGRRGRPRPERACRRGVRGSEW